MAIDADDGDRVGPSSGIDRRNDATVSFAGLGLGILIASATPVLVAGATLEGLAVSAWRIWIAGAVFLLLTLVRGRLTFVALTLTVRAGMAFGLATALFFSALQLTSVANATLITVMQPLPLMVAARVMFGERLARADLGWTAVAIGGAVLMVLAADSAGTSDLGGDALALGSMLAASAYFIFGKRARESLDTDVYMAGLLAWTAAVLTPVLLVSGQAVVPPSTGEWLRMASLGGVVVVGHGLINFANGRLPLTVIGLFQLFVPVCAGLLAWVFLDQRISVGQAIGMAIVLLALSAHTRHSATA